MLLVKINFILKKIYGPTSCPSQLCLQSITKYNCKQDFFKVCLSLDCVSAIFQLFVTANYKTS